MAAQPLPGPLPLLLALADDMADGAHNHGVAIKLKQNDEAAIRSALDPCRAAFVALGTAQDAISSAFKALHAADASANTFLKAARAVLVQSLGNTWSANWAPTGFPGQSTAVPDTQDERYTLCNSLATYLTNNPDMEVNSKKVVVTAAAATACYNAIKTARGALHDRQEEAVTAQNVCDAAEAALRIRMRGLINELGQLLDDNSPLWKSFGLPMPGADVTPHVVDGLAVQLGAAGTAQASWFPAEHADHYRTWQQVVGVDMDYVNVGSPTDCAYAYAALPSGKTVNFGVTAANPAGESAMGNIVTLVVP